jgi:hypothetical protein
MIASQATFAMIGRYGGTSLVTLHNRPTRHLGERQVWDTVTRHHRPRRRAEKIYRAVDECVRGSCAQLLFDVIATAYERSSVIVTTNLLFENWTEVLGSKRLTGATLDRLTHRCKIIETKGESYRLQDAAKRSRTRKS